MTDARIKAVFLEALELPPSGRGGFLDRACGGDAALRAEVERLLEANQAAGAFMLTPTAGIGGRDLEESIAAGPDAEQPGQLIGPYRLIRRIGQGGFGSVYVAEQEHPVRRTVALKIIKAGMDTAGVMARFEAERQTLARMDHPHIAKVLGAGATSTGRPYFVMEYVEGEPITAYCDRHHLRIPDRLTLFAQVCAAVQHAHTKGIIHRDLKPGNVLVALQDGVPAPKIIDFGIAKATAPEPGRMAGLTQVRELLGTPAYMSPEQATVAAHDIDTRSDVYSLGVLLYELLVGMTPFDSATLERAALAEVQRIIREVDPPQPSTRLGRLEAANAGAPPASPPEDAQSIATHRATTPAALARAVRGDLDWIVMKALEKDRARRYGTASEFALDIQRSLTSQPVLAGPPSRIYRVRKFVRRHQVPVAAATAVLAMLIAATAVSVAFGLKEARARQQETIQRNLALQREADANQARALADRRRAQTEQVTLFHAQMLERIDATQAGRSLMQDLADRYDAALGRAGTVPVERASAVETLRRTLAQINATDAATGLIDRALLRPAVNAIDAEFQDQPTVSGALRQTLADVYLRLGLYEAALPLQQQAVDDRRRALGDDHDDTLATMNHMSRLLQFMGRWAEAETYFRTVLDSSRRLYGDDHPRTLTAINNMGTFLQTLGRSREAEPLLREALAAKRRTQGDDDPSTLSAMSNLGSVLRSEGRLTEAEPLLREVVERRTRISGPDDAATLVGQSSLCLLLQAQGHLQEAESCLRDNLERRARTLGEEHPATLGAMNNLGSLLMAAGRPADAETCLRRAVELSTRGLGPEQPVTLACSNSLGFLLASHGDAEGAAILESVLSARRRTLGDAHPDTLITISHLGVYLIGQGRLDEAEALLLPAAATAETALNPEHPTRDSLAHAMVKLYEALETSRPGSGYGAHAAEWQARLGPAPSR